MLLIIIKTKMGRFNKAVINIDGIDRRESGYYSTPNFVARFLTSRMLEINPNGNYVLDPSVGKEELLELFHQDGKQIDSFDIADFGLHDKSNFVQKDFLDFYRSIRDETLFNFSKAPGYDFYICNPPYNCHENDYIRKNKKVLQGLFPDVGVGNMYSMFLSAIIELAKDGALIGVITQDSFLTSISHRYLRDQILDNCAIHHISLCPTDLFRDQAADVRTCLLILQKGKHHQRDVKISDRPLNTLQFQQILQDNHFDSVEISQIILSGDKDNNEFVIGCPNELKSVFQYPRLREVFRCVTGISTGNDSKYISKEQTEHFSVPFFKNPGSKRFTMEPSGFLPQNFLQIERQVPNFIVRNKDILFKQGISCSSMGVPFSACYLPEGATFGVNANIICDPTDINWLLSYLNSSLVTYMVRGVLIRTNMITSGYVSRIPIIPLDPSQKSALGVLAEKALGASQEEIRNLIPKIDSILFEALDFSKETINKIKFFCDNLIRLT